MSQAKRASGWWYPWIFVGGMGVVVVVNGFLFFFALDSWTGLETDSHYKRGLEYNTALDATTAQRVLGWQTTLTVTPAEGGERKFDVAVTFLDKSGQPLRDLTVDAIVRRPTHEGYDAQLSLNPKGNGAYGGQAALALPGVWDVRLIAQRGDDHFQSVERVQIP